MNWVDPEYEYQFLILGFTRLEFELDSTSSGSGGATEAVNKSSGNSYGIYTRKELVPERNDVGSSWQCTMILSL